MKPRRGFTLVELLVVMAIFGLALGFVFYDFRGADERASLRRATVDIVQRLREMQSWALGNRQPSVTVSGTRVTLYGLRFQSESPLDQSAFGWVEEATPLVFRSLIPIVQQNLGFSNPIAFDPDINIHKIRYGQDTCCANVFSTYTVGFALPGGAARTEAGGDGVGIEFESNSLYVYLRYRDDTSRCMEILFRSTGDISTKEGSC